MITAYLYLLLSGKVEFRETAKEEGYKEIIHISLVQEFLENGARIGSMGEGRFPTYARAQ